MRKGLLVLIAAIALSSAGLAMAAAEKTPEIPSLDYLKKWEGFYPFGDYSSPPDPNGPGRKAIWDDALFIAAIKRDLGEEFYEKVFSNASTAPKIEKHGDYLYLQLCRPHMCEPDFLRLFVDLRKGEVMGCVHGFQEYTSTPGDYWVAKGTKKLLTPGACEKMGGYAPKAYQ